MMQGLDAAVRDVGIARRDGPSAHGGGGGFDGVSGENETATQGESKNDTSLHDVAPCADALGLHYVA
jgi:hypothetical protein